MSQQPKITEELSRSDGSTAVVFPGQGTPRNGMARDFCEATAKARAVFEEASDALGLDVSALCWNDDPRLAMTEYAQPAITTAEIAMLGALEELFGFRCDYFGGHSLGEYTALVAAGVVSLGDAVALVRERGRLMQAAVPLGSGAMLAIIQPSLGIEALMKTLAGSEVDLANINCSDQVVISGAAADVEAIGKTIRDIDGCGRARCLPLRVSAPFHSRLMRPAAESFAPVLEAARNRWRAERAVRVTSNYSGSFHEGSADSVCDLLVRQITAPVRWLDNMEALAGCAERIIEIGPGRPLRGFFASVGKVIHSVSTLEAAQQILG